MIRPDPSRLRWRILVANLAVAGLAVLAVVAAVWLTAPQAFEAAMGHPPGGGMMGGPSRMPGSGAAMMDPFVRSAFGEAIGTAILLGLAAAVSTSFLVSMLVATRLARPIHDLAVASRRVATGDYTARVPAGDGEIGELGARFNDMAAALETNERRRRDLVGDVAHELRTPIASVRGYVTGLEAGVFEPGPSAWRVLDAQTGRLERLVDDLALLWRAEAEDLSLEIRTLDAATVLADAAARSRPEASERDTLLSVAAPPFLPVRGDAVRVAQVLDNLVANALRYVPVGGSVRLAARGEPGFVVLTVADDGVGMTPEQLARVFDRFYRADPSRSRDHGGTGLGLAIARSLAAAMGGSLEAASPGLGRGSVFSLRLPS